MRGAERPRGEGGDDGRGPDRLGPLELDESLYELLVLPVVRRAMRPPAPPAPPPPPRPKPGATPPRKAPPSLPRIGYEHEDLATDVVTPARLRGLIAQARGNEDVTMSEVSIDGLWQGAFGAPEDDDDAELDGELESGVRKIE